MQIPNLKRLCLYSLIAMLTFLCSNATSAKASPSLYLDTNSQTGYKLAAIQFLPDYSYEDETYRGNAADKCAGFTLTSVSSVSANASRCPYDRNRYRINSCKSGYKAVYTDGVITDCTKITCGNMSETISKGEKCLKVSVEGVLTCYTDCQKIDCADEYKYNCLNKPANAKTMVKCPSCNPSGSNMTVDFGSGQYNQGTVVAECGTDFCKISECNDGYKLSEDGLSCVPKDDTCPSGFFKECETGKTDKFTFTEAGSTCFQCQPPETDQEKCEKEGYHTMDYWETLKPTSGFGKIPGLSYNNTNSNSFAYILNNLVGIKTAQAEDLVTTDLDQKNQLLGGGGTSGLVVPTQGCSSSCTANSCGTAACQYCSFCQTLACISKNDCSRAECKDADICKPTVSTGDWTIDGISSGVSFTTYEFEIRTKCPYDPNYVKGQWVAVKKCTENTCSGYTLDECPENGVCDKCTLKNTDCSSSGNKYKLTSCAEGYIVSANGNSCNKSLIQIDPEIGGNNSGNHDLVIPEESTCYAVLGQNISDECLNKCVEYVKKNGHAPSSCASLEQSSNNSLGILDNTVKSHKF